VRSRGKLARVLRAGHHVGIVRSELLPTHTIVDSL